MSGFDDWIAGARPKMHAGDDREQIVVNARTRAVDRRGPGRPAAAARRSDGDERVEQPVGEEQAEAAASQRTAACSR